MDIMLLVAVLLFVVQIVAWMVLPNSKQVSETTIEFSSIGDESKAVASAA
jgi:hypothetical protein